MSADPFRRAAQAYLVYGLVYWIGGVYLVLHGVGVTDSRSLRALAPILLGTMFLVFIPMLLARPRPWFERRVLSRRSFARVLVLFLIVRAYKVGQVAFRAETATVAAPWGGEITYRTGATVFLVVTIAALLVIARAAWSTPPRVSYPTSTPSPLDPPLSRSGPTVANEDRTPLLDIKRRPTLYGAPATNGGLLQIKPPPPRSTRPRDEGSTPSRP